jgi:hypothetical protein
MLHRMTTLLSTVVVVSVAALVPSAVFPTAARAADNCFARPTGSPPDGGHWYFQTNRVTHRKCWVLGAKRIPGAATATVRNAALQGLSNLTSFNALAEPVTADACTDAPKGRAARGSHWHYHTDDATGQGCWWRSGQISNAQASRLRVSKPQIPEAEMSAARISVGQLSEARISRIEISRTGNVIPAPSPESANLAARTIPPVAFQRAAEDAGPEFLNEFNVPARRIESASLLAPVATNENLATSTFASRWSNLLDPALSDDRRLGSLGQSQLDLPVPALFDDVTNSIKAGDRLFTTERSLYVTLLVFLASLLGALVVFGLIGGVVLHLRARYARSAPPRRPDPPPEGGVFRNGSPPAPLRPDDFTRNIAEIDDPSGPDSPSAAKRFNVGDRRVRQFENVECCG